MISHGILNRLSWSKMVNAMADPPFEVYALLWLTRGCESKVRNVLKSIGIPNHAIQRGLHLTVYHAHRPLPGLRLFRRHVKISADVAETRFMVLAPGGENPRPEHDPAHRSVGIRLTKRNAAIGDIQELRESLYRLETPEVVGNRKRTTAWRNAFGARHYQPHIKLLKPGNGLEKDLTVIGKSFRSSLRRLEFGKYEVKIRSPAGVDPLRGKVRETTLALLVLAVGQVSGVCQIVAGVSLMV